MAQSKRLLSLDVLRGITIAGMILVNNPGTWSTVYAPLRHASWDGLTPTDLVFPFFIFIMGVSMFFSLRKYEFSLSKQSVYKVVHRTILIFLLGVVLNFTSGIVSRSIPDAFANLRILGVMQRLAIAYGVGSIIVLIINHKYILHTVAAILVFYGALIGLTGSTMLNDSNIIAVIDRAVFGAAHMYVERLPEGGTIAFDPLGLISSLGSIAQVLIGFTVGKFIFEAKADKETVIRKLFILGTIALFLGFFSSYGCPVNKKIWSASFVLVTSGLCSLLLGLLVWIIDIKNKTRWSRPFEVFGINPLYLYVQAHVLSILLRITGIKTFIYSDVLCSILGAYSSSLAYALFFVALNWVPGYFLYKKKIYIKL